MMDSTLDFLGRARHAWQEFRKPSDFDAVGRESQHPAAEGPNDAQSRKSAELFHRNPVEPISPLMEFRLLVGIYQDKSFRAPNGFKPNRRPQVTIAGRSAPNMGIYTTVCDREIKCKRNYKFASRLINTCLGLQIVVAAALTALGAANGNRKAVTVFGAINTVIAGFLTYLKGSGMPQRLKYFQHEWAKVREYIEQRERDFSFSSSSLSVYEEIDKIRGMFEAVKAEIETNTPERFVSATSLRNQPSHHSAANPPQPALARPQPSFSTDSFGAKRWLSEKETEANTAVNKGHGAISNIFSGLSHLKSHADDKAKEVGQMEKDIESSGRRVVDEKTADASRAMGEAHDTASNLFSQVSYLKEALEGKMKDLGHAEKEIEGQGREMVDEKRKSLAERVQRAVQDVEHLGKEISGAAAHEQGKEVYGAEEKGVPPK